MGCWDKQNHCGKTRVFGIKRPMRGIILDMLFNFSKLQFLYL